MVTLPDPPPQLSVRHLPWTPLHREKLRRSKAWRAAKKNPEVGFYMVNLWMAAWESEIAASLEDDDGLLADLAGCDEGRWPEVRETALTGFEKRSDGLLYHGFVLDMARDALDGERKRREREKKQAQRAAKKRWNGSGNIKDELRQEGYEL